MPNFNNWLELPGRIWRFIVSNVTAINASIRQQAEAELAQEQAAAAKAVIKRLLKQRQAAVTALANIDREIADAEAAIEQGNLPG